MSTHSRFGGSIIGVIAKCPDYPNATAHVIDEGDTSQAELGTGAHMLGERSLNLGFEPEHYLGKKFNGCDVDHDMVEQVNIYVNHIRALRISHPRAKSMLEQRVVLSSIASDVFGTADHLMIDLENRTLYVDDYKHGYVAVDEEGYQLPFYGVGALDTFNLWFAVDKVVCTIVQPRADHVRGAVRTVEYDMNDMRNWLSKFIEVVEKARQPDAPRVAGPHCHYCPVKANCRPRLIHTVVNSSLESPLKTINSSQLDAILNEIPSIIKHLEAIEEEALIRARGGQLFDNFKLVKGRVRAVCKDEATLIEKATKAGVDKSELHNPGKIKGKSVLKTLGVPQDVLDECFETPEAQTQLVPLHKSATAVSRTAAGVFKPIKKEN